MNSHLAQLNIGRLRYEIDDPLPVPPIFSLIQELGDVGDDEMREVFNLGCGFCVVEDSLDVEEVEVVRSGRVGCSVEDAGGCTAQIVGREVAQGGAVGGKADEALDGAGLGDGIAPGELPGAAARLFPADDGIGWTQRPPDAIGVGVEVGGEEVEQCRAADDATGTTGLADPGNVGRRVVEAEVADPESNDLLRSHAGQAEAEE